MKYIMIRMIRFYQKYLSPLKSTKCPYYPTCSQYGLEAIQKYGAVKGGCCTPENQSVSGRQAQTKERFTAGK